MQAEIDLNALGREQLATLSSSVYGSQSVSPVQRVFDLLVPPGRRSTSLPSYVTDDHTPFEFSLVLGPVGARRTPELRVLAEPPDHDKGLAGTIASGRSLAKTLQKEHGAHLARLDAVDDLFLPADPQGPFALWFAANLGPDGSPSFKVYLNPRVRGPGRAGALVEEMLERLGMHDSWEVVSRASRRGPDRDELRFVSLDLVDSPTARVKVYTFHHAASVGDLEHVMGLAQYSDPELLRAFCRTVTGGEGLLNGERQVGTCLSFVGNEARTCTVHVPIRSYAGDDETARARIELAIAELGLDGEVYRKAIAAFPRRPLRKGAGLHSYSSLRFEADGPRLNLYLSPELLAVHPASAPTRPVNAAPSPRETPLSVATRYEEQLPFSSHPFFQRMARRPVDLVALTMLMLNFREAVTRDFSRRLASVVARLEEDSLRCILAKQLNDELGNGEFTRAHAGLFDRLCDGLLAYRPVELPDAALAPGRRFGAELEAIYTQRSPYEGLGAALIAEVGGRQVDAFMGEQFRRQSSVPPSVLEWLTLHETLEVDHVDEVFVLATAIPEGPKADLAARGACDMARAAASFFDAMYEVHAP